MNNYTHCLKQFVFVATALLCATTHIVAQSDLSEALSLTMWDCIKMSRDQGYTAEIAEDNFLASQYQFEAYESGLLPQLNLSANLPGFNRSISEILQPDGTLIPLEQEFVQSSAFLSLSQRIPWLGSTISVNSGLRLYDDFGDIRQWQSTPLLVSLNQPLLRFNQFAWDEDIQPIRMQRAQSKRIEDLEDVSIDAVRAYFDLSIATVEMENAQRDVQSNDSIYQISSGRYQVGSIAENALLQSELALTSARMQLTNARDRVELSKEALRIVLGISEQVVLTVLEPDTAVFDVAITPQQAVARALSHNSTIVQQQEAILLAQQEADRVSSNNSFGATLTASAGLNQSANELGQAYSDLLESQAVTIGVSMPLYTWSRASSLKQEAETRVRIAEKSAEQMRRLFANTVREQVLRLARLREQVAITARSKDLAERSFAVAKNRYVIGKIALTDLIIAQDEKNRALVSYNSTLRDYWIAWFTVRKLTHYDWAQNMPLR